MSLIPVLPAFQYANYYFYPSLSIGGKSKPSHHPPPVRVNEPDSMHVKRRVGAVHYLRCGGREVRSSANIALYNSPGTAQITTLSLSFNYFCRRPIAKIQRNPTICRTKPRQRPPSLNPSTTETSPHWSFKTNERLQLPSY